MAIFFWGESEFIFVALAVGKGERDVCLIIVGDAFFFASAIP